MSPVTTSPILGPALVSAVERNDETVLQQFYTANYSQVERFVLQQSGSSDDAADVYQEAYLAVWRNIKLGKYKSTDVAPAAYLFQIAKFKWMDQLRSRKKMLMASVAEVPDSSEPAEKQSEENIRLIAEQLAELGEPCRELLTMFYAAKKTMKEIGEKFSWTEATAKNNKYRCIEKLRKRVQDLRETIQL